MEPYSHLIAVTDRHLCRGDFLAQIRKITALEPCAVILRERDLSDSEYETLAIQVQEICRKADTPFFVHARIELARRIGCENIHLPLPLLQERGARPEGFRTVSTSCHSMEDMHSAAFLGADRIILGTIFETACKKGIRGKGLPFVREICQASALPVYAIGGIKESNIASVMDAGAAGGCMMSKYMQL